VNKLVHKAQKLVANIRTMHGYENSETKIIKAVNMLDDICIQLKLMDKELTIVHEVLTELYNYDVAYPLIKTALDKIDTLYSKELNKNSDIIKLMQSSFCPKDKYRWGNTCHYETCYSCIEDVLTPIEIKTKLKEQDNE
jgi:hypothetical protein